MKMLVTYYSQTGNTKKIADAIYEELNTEKEILNIKEIEDLTEYDFTFIGFPIHKFGLPEKVKEFIAKNSKGKKIALFITHAMPSNSTAFQPLLEKCKETASGAGADLSGVFHCRGELSEKIAKVMLNNDDPNIRNFGGMREKSIGHPDSSEKNEAKLFAKDIVRKLKKFSH